jgi:hypothetical protein
MLDMTSTTINPRQPLPFESSGMTGLEEPEMGAKRIEVDDKSTECL